MTLEALEGAVTAALTENIQYRQHLDILSLAGTIADNSAYGVQAERRRR